MSEDQAKRSGRGEQDRRRWEQRAEWPLTGAALAFLVAWSWPILDPGISAGARWLCWVVTWLAWAVFAVDYVVRLLLAGDRRRFVSKHLLDLAVVVLPIFRPVGPSGLVTYVAAVAMLDAERGHPGANITSFGDSLWWALVTMMTVGYGDQYPVTATGRVIGAGLMVCGVALLGIVTATLASWLVDRVSDVNEEQQTATRHDIERLRAEIRALHARLGDPETDEDRQVG